jgi:hypothetical protein
VFGINGVEGALLLLWAAGLLLAIATPRRRGDTWQYLLALVIAAFVPVLGSVLAAVRFTLVHQSNRRVESKVADGRKR